MMGLVGRKTRERRTTHATRNVFAYTVGTIRGLRGVRSVLYAHLPRIIRIEPLMNMFFSVID